MSFPCKILADLDDHVIDNQCLGLMPFQPAFDPIDQTIRAVCGELELDYRRADDLDHSRAIMTDIIELIHRSRYIIADVTGLNANVVYELGISHTLKESVVLITQSIAELPFDIRQLRAIEYTPDPDGLAALRERLASALRSLQSPTLSSPYYRPIRIEAGLKNTLGGIVREFGRCKARHGDELAMVRCMPAEITEAMVGQQSDLTNELKEYQNYITDIVSEGDQNDNWDYSIYGTTPSAAINAATAAFVENLYFGATPPGTSMVGFDVKVFDSGFIVLGNSPGDIDNFTPDTAIILFRQPNTAKYENSVIVRDQFFCAQLVNSWYRPLSETARLESRYNFVNGESIPTLRTAAERVIHFGGKSAFWRRLAGLRGRLGF